MSRVVLSIGSNMGDRLGHLQSFVDLLGVRVAAVSAVYETGAWGPVEQEDFLNAVVVADAEGVDAPGWLALGQSAETSAGRVRTVRWGPRPLDVDLIEVTDDGVPVVSDDPDLVLPHPLARRRAFVLAPWIDVAGPERLPELAASLARLPSEARAGVRRTSWALRPAEGGTKS